MRAHVLAVLALPLLACGDDDSDGNRDGGPVCDPFPVTLEIRSPEDAYVAPPSDADLVLGFQGFRYIYVRARVDAQPPVTRGSVVAEPDSLSPVSQPARFVFSEEGGAFVSDPVPVFFNDIPLPTLIGRGCRVWIRVGDERCGGTAEGRVMLRYDPACYEGAMGERICNDGGAPVFPDAGADLDAAAGAP